MSRRSSGNGSIPVRPVAAEEESSLLRVIAILRRRVWLLASIWGFTIVLSAVLTLLQTPVYRAESTLEIRPEKPLLAGDLTDPAREGLQASQLWESYLRTQESLLRSRRLLHETLESLPAEFVQEYAAAPDPLQAFARDLEIETVSSTFLVRIALVHPSPESGTRLVNALVAHYLEEAHRRLRDLKSDTLEALSTETLPSLRQKADEAVRNLREFQAETGYADFEERHASLVEARRKVDSRLSEIRLRNASLRSQRDSLGAPGFYEKAGLLPPAFQSLKPLEPLVAQSAALEEELTRAAQELKESHPRLRALRGQREILRRRFEETLSAAVRSIDRDLEAAGMEEQALGVEQEKIDLQVSDARLRLAQCRKLEAEQTTTQELYTSYLKKYGETRATSGTGLASVRIVDPAEVPREPFRRSPLFLTLGAILGLLFGAVGVVIAEQVDDRLFPPYEKWLTPKLEVLTVIPRIGSTPGHRRAPLVMADDPFMLTLEPVRALRDEVHNRLQGTPEARVIAVAGPRTGEGKTTVALNLARVVALEGRRVLIVDAELRRPSLKALLADPEGKGLEEYLRGELSLSQAIQSSRIPGLDVLGADQCLERPAESAGSARFRTGLEEACRLYDTVILDAGPVNLFSEVASIARYADATLLVVREGWTRRSEARDAANRLTALGARVLGAVINRSRSPGSASWEPAGSRAADLEQEQEYYVVL